VLRIQLAAKFPQVTRWQIAKLQTSASLAQSERSREGSTPVQIGALGPRVVVTAAGARQWFSVAGFARALAARQSVARGAELSPALGVLEERDIVGAGCAVLTDAQVLRGMRARRGISAGQLLCADVLEARPAVCRGDRVLVRYAGTHVSITTTAIAQSDGAAGAAVLVRNPATSINYRAEVTGLREVTIHE
jgi:flagella basal body P-ring formation protein FlgA